MLLEVLAPTNTTHRPFPVAAGGSAVLQPVPLPGHEDEVAPLSPSGQQTAEEDAAAAAAAAAPQQAQQSPPNAWLDRAAAKSRQQAAAAGAAAPATPPKHLAPACSASRSPFQSCTAGPSDAVVMIGPAAACSSRGGPPEPSTSSGSTATGPGGCGALGAGCASGGYVSESSGEATGLREWSMWDSASSPSLFESLHSVVAQGSQPLGGGSGSYAGAQVGWWGGGGCSGPLRSRAVHSFLIAYASTAGVVVPACICSLHAAACTASVAAAAVAAPVLRSQPEGRQCSAEESGAAAALQDGAAASSGWQQPTPLGLPFPTAPAWPSTPPGLAMPQQQGPVPMALDTHPFCWGSTGW